MSTLRDFLSAMTEGVTPSRWRPNAPISLQDAARNVLDADGYDEIRNRASLFWVDYMLATDELKLELFAFFNTELGLDVEATRSALEAYDQDPNARALSAFNSAAEAPRRELFRRLNQTKDGTGCLVSMRQDLLAALREDKSLAAVDVDLKFLLRAWFNLGVLELRPLNWCSPANVLEKLIKYEAVHQIDSWRALRQRTEPPDRRCFGYFHPSMPDEPIIFVQVALSETIPDSITDILSETRDIAPPETVSVAAFYSISNCQDGLSGISFGNFLIKQVVKFLQLEFETLQTFVTLSPIPGFASWVEATLPDPQIAEDAETRRQLVAHYLLEVSSKRGGPQDPVARFHLGNGARIHAIHPDADLSEKGRAQSFGSMVNYLYELSEISTNHHAFTSDGTIVSSKNVTQLAALGRQKIARAAA